MSDLADPPARQNLDNLRGEVRFRRYHQEGTAEHLSAYIRRAVEQRTGQFTHLLLRGMSLSPFIELGCETAANGTALAARLGQRGFSVDISLDALRAADRYRRDLGYDAGPLRVCCDLNDLPFRSGALRFALAWGTLHHFPDPRVPLGEVRRTLARTGLFYFDGEPVRRLLSLNLRATRSIYSMSRIERLLLRLRVLPWLFAIDGAEAMAEGALEMKFSAWEWKRFLPDVFETVQFRWRPYLTAEMLSVNRPTWRVLEALLGTERAEKLVAALFGGAVWGEAYKLPDVTARRLPAPPGTRRIAAKKPQGNDRLIIRFSGSVPGRPGPAIRIGADSLSPDPEPAGPGTFVYRLSPYPTGDGVLDILIPDAPEELEAVDLATDGPVGYTPCDPDEPSGPDFPADADLESLLACPSCRIPAERPTFARTEDRPPLVRSGDEYRCDACGTRYPIMDGIPVLLRPELAEALGYR